MEEFLEEQEMEVQALEAIYMDDFKWVSSPTTFYIELVPFAQHEMEKDSYNHVSVQLLVQYSSNYPQTLPETLCIRHATGISDEQRQELEQLIETTAEQLLETPMIFSVASEVKDWLLANNFPLLSDHQKAVQRKNKHLPQAVEEETQGQIQDKNARFEEVEVYGTMFSEEAFMRWKVEFEVELFAKEMKEAEYGVEASRITGKRLFEAKAARQLGVPLPDHIWFDEDLFDEDVDLEVE